MERNRKNIEKKSSDFLKVIKYIKDLCDNLDIEYKQDNNNINLYSVDDFKYFRDLLESEINNLKFDKIIIDEIKVFLTNVIVITIKNEESYQKEYIKIFYKENTTNYFKKIINKILG